MHVHYAYDGLSDVIFNQAIPIWSEVIKQLQFMLLLLLLFLVY